MMATARSQQSTCNLVFDSTFELKYLQTEAGSKHCYNGFVIQEDTLLVIDSNACNLQLLICRGDNLLHSSLRLESEPSGVCRISMTEVAVCLTGSKILIVSVKSIDDIKLVKSLNICTGFYGHSVGKLNSSDKLVFSGRKDDGKGSKLCWGIASITDGIVHSTHYICRGIHSHLAIRDNTVYISCQTSCTTINHGVYAYDICNPNTHKFLYRHQELKAPGSITVGRDSIFVCDLGSDRIHQLTDSGHLVTIHTVYSRPRQILYDDQHGVLYTTSYDRYRSNLITVYRLEYLNQPEHDYRLQRIAKVLKDQYFLLNGKITDEDDDISHNGHGTVSLEEDRDEDQNVLYRRTSEQDIDQDLSSTASQHDECPAHHQEEPHSTFVQKNPTQSETKTIAISKCKLC